MRRTPKELFNNTRHLSFIIIGYSSGQVFIIEADSSSLPRCLFNLRVCLFEQNRLSYQGTYLQDIFYETAGHE